MNNPYELQDTESGQPYVHYQKLLDGWHAPNAEKCRGTNGICDYVE
jgi:hypothetical protein